MRAGSPSPRREVPGDEVASPDKSAFAAPLNLPAHEAVHYCFSGRLPELSFTTIFSFSSQKRALVQQ